MRSLSGYSTRIHLTISTTLLERIDTMAREDYTTRSEIVRQSLVYYLRSVAMDDQSIDTKELFKNLKRREGIRYLNKVIKDTDVFDDIG